MDATAAADRGAAGRWILLIHHLPPKPDYLRVKVRRRLQGFGAVPLKNSVYVLPDTPAVLERVVWLRRMIVEEGGEATVCTAAIVDGVSDDALEVMFTAQVEEEYRRVAEAAEAARAAPADADLRRLRRQLSEAAERDFFGAAGAVAARIAVAEVEGALAGRAPASAGKAAPIVVPRGATWVTRRDVFIDRIASAWLIRRFVDPTAVFKFVPAKGYHRRAGEIRFDMIRGEFNCDAERCTFQVLVQHFTPDDAALSGIGEIVHDVDVVEDEKFGREETPGVATLIRGIVENHRDDGGRVAAGLTLFDGLYTALGGGTRAPGGGGGGGA